MAPAARDREPEILKDSRQVFFWVQKFLDGSGFWKVQRGEIMVVANGMWSKQNGMTIVKWPNDQFSGEQVLIQLFDQTYHYISNPITYSTVKN